MEYTLANILIITILTYYTKYMITILFNKNYRTGIQQDNKVLENLRCKPIKTIEEQKAFINIRYPKKIGTFRWSWRLIPQILLTVIIFITIFQFYIFIFNKFNFDFVLWQAILFFIFFPLILNLILHKLNIQKGDISVFFRGGKK